MDFAVLIASTADRVMVTLANYFCIICDHATFDLSRNSTSAVMARLSRSCEPHRSAAYSEDMRWRMVFQHEVQEQSYVDIAKNSYVDVSTVRRILNLFWTTGDVQKRQYPSNAVKASQKLTDVAQLFIITLLLDRPGIFLQEIQTELDEQLGIEVTPSCICKFLRKNGFSRQRIYSYAIQRDEELRLQFMDDVSIYESPGMFIFLDEMGTDRRDIYRKKGYSVRGKPLRERRLLVRGKHLSCIAFLSINGLLDWEIVNGTVDGDRFYEFVQRNLLPKLQPFNGINPHSVVIMDNASIHHVDDVVGLINEVGALVHFLPSYSPDLNPIEEAFSKVKNEMKKGDNCDDIEDIVLKAFSTITADDCKGWIADSKIYI